MNGRSSLPGTGTALCLVGLLLGLRAFTFSVNNPDIFWHLAAGRAMWAARALPRADVFSWTELGRPWLDFEWLSELLYFALFRACGVWGLLGLKLLVMAAALWASARILAMHGYGRAAQGLVMLVEGCALMPFGDVRPDNFSIALFAGLLWLLERRRLAPRSPTAGTYAAAAAAFALWSNLHLGVVYGLLLIGLFAAGEALEGRVARARETAALLAVAAAATLANPYGWGLWAVLANHWRYMGLLTATLTEWARPPFHDPSRWPALALMAACAAAAVQRARARRPAAWAWLLGLTYFAAGALRHDRHLTFFAAFAAPGLFVLLKEEAQARPRPFAALAAAAFLLFGASMGRFAFEMPRLLEPRQQLGDFLAAQRETLSPLPLYNTWGDGGYLDWRLPEYKVFFDGRYIFHELLGEADAAALSAVSWQEFLRRRGVELASMRRSPRTFTQDGVARPYYLSYMPARDWALVHWDDTRLVFVARAAVPASWLRAHEFRFLRPDDLAYAASGRESAAPEDVKTEILRLEAESPSVGPEVYAFVSALRRAR